jgi:hypothetical protein
MNERLKLVVFKEFSSVFFVWIYIYNIRKIIVDGLRLVRPEHSYMFRFT